MTMEKCDSQQEGRSVNKTPEATMTGQDVDRNHFPSRLHTMLSTLENSPDGLGSPISWQPHGRVFMIRDTDLFVQQILPKWFCRLKFTSFQRQLCLYGFRKLSKKGPDQGGYYHLSFIRERLDLAKTIQPGKIKGKRGRRPKSDESEPDFYKMPSSLEEQRPAGATAPAPALPLPTKPTVSVSVAPTAPEPLREAHRVAQLENPRLSTKEESPEQLSLEAIIQQPQFQEEIFEGRQQEPQPRVTDTQWPSIAIQQSLALESCTMTNLPQKASLAEGNFQPEELLLPQAAAPATAAAPPRSATARRMSDFSVSDTVPTWGWDSFSGIQDPLSSLPPALPAALEQSPVPSLTLGTTLQESHPQPQHQQLQQILPQQEQMQLQQILQQQRLKDLMDLNQKQQKNLKIQQEQLEQQRLELQMRDQEQLEQLRVELQARGEQQRRQSMGRAAEPLPRPPALFKPQLPAGRVAFQSQLQSQAQQQRQQQQQQLQGQGQGQGQTQKAAYGGMFQHQNRTDRNPPY